MKRLFFFFAVQLLMATAVQSQDYSNSDFVKGADVGFLQGQERRGVVFHDRNGKERECLECLFIFERKYIQALA